ncbi:hypothetical protein [Actinacidiphila guanduensis]|uniref:Uncharacterized protein n=1 Tax=Actinacidiphila guanduensis TaxID=310781 RepID=A0A1H0DJQ8_9ACTN|nr:hypothetical protein [Actinacidiphila guanduensis]SDN70382.1 hypothetical protein SAMN05216259_105249 [Actinacidiphila guanduensis]
MADADREDEGAAPLDEDAAWAALVAGFDAEPDPGAAASWPEAENVPEGDAEVKEPPSAKNPAAVAPPPTRSIVIHPVIAGPRNYELEDDEEDAHFVPPEPPPLPDADLTTKFAWIAVLGGPLLLFAFVLLQLDLAWWVILVGVGGFLGGFATLVARMRTGEDDDDLPGGGAVV